MATLTILTGENFNDINAAITGAAVKGFRKKKSKICARREIRQERRREEEDNTCAGARFFFDESRGMLVNTAMAQIHTHRPDLAHGKQSFEDMLHAVGRHQDRESFIALFRHFAPRIKSFLMKGGATPEQADELAQETMLTVWDKAQNYDPRQAGASTWIYTIARNKKIDALRKAGRVEIANADTALLESDDPAPSESVIRAEEIESIGRALKDLPREQALLLQKSFFEDKSHADIAAEMKLPLGTVKSRIRLALDKLRQDKGVKALW